MDLAVKRNQMPPSHFFALFPRLFNCKGNVPPSDRIARTFYARLLGLVRGDSCPLPVAATQSTRSQSRVEAAPGYWVKVADAVFVPPAGSHGAEQVSQTLLDTVVECLLRCGVPLVDAPQPVLESIERVLEPRKPVVLTPAWLREFLRSSAGSRRTHVLKKQQASTVFSELAPEDVASFLEFCISDGRTADLQGVPLLMCDDELTVHVFSDDAQAVFFPQTPLERRLFPNKEGRKLLLSTRLESRPMVWAKLKEMALAFEAGLKSDAQPGARKGSQSFQCKVVTYELLVEALQTLLPRTWNDPVPQVQASDYAEWIEDWLQAMWKWLDAKEIPLSRLVHWPLIPSLGGGSNKVDLFRIPERHKMVLFSDCRPRKPPPPPPPPPPAQPSQQASQPAQPAQPPAKPVAGSQPPPETQDDGRKETATALAPPSTAALMQELLLVLHCRPVSEPAWLLEHHQKQVRTCVHASTPEGFLRTIHYASKLLSSAKSAKGDNVKPAAALHSALCNKLDKHHAKALLVVAAFVQREGCTCETAAAPNWKVQCEALSGLPLFCKFNEPEQRLSLAYRGASKEPKAPKTLVLLPETCPQVVSALRAAQVELGCGEIPEDVLLALAAAESAAVSTLLRELSLPRLKWADLLQARGEQSALRPKTRGIR